MASCPTPTSAPTHSFLNIFCSLLVLGIWLFLFYPFFFLSTCFLHLKPIILIIIILQLLLFNNLFLPFFFYLLCFLLIRILRIALILVILLFAQGHILLVFGWIFKTRKISRLFVFSIIIFNIELINLLLLWHDSRIIRFFKMLSYWQF